MNEGTIHSCIKRAGNFHNAMYDAASFAQWSMPSGRGVHPPIFFLSRAFLLYWDSSDPEGVHTYTNPDEGSKPVGQA